MEDLDRLLERIDRLAVVADLKPKATSGKEILLTCPKCHQPDAYLMKDGRAIICRRANHCGYTTSLLELVSGVRNPRGADFQKACDLLAKTGGTYWETRELSPAVKAKIELANNKKAALYAIQEICTKHLRLLADDFFANHSAVDYLLNRNFKPEVVLDYGFGVINDVVFKELREKVQNEILSELAISDENGRFNPKWTDRITIPLRDAKGVLCGIAGRAYGANQPKYLNTKGVSLNETIAIELRAALDYSPILIAVEGYLDPFKARQEGLFGVVAIGSTGHAFNTGRWEGLYDAGCRQLVFIADRDRAGERGLLACLEKHGQSKKAPDVFVATLPVGKDLDEWIDITLQSGESVSEQFQEHYSRRIHSDRFMAITIAKDYDLTTEAGKWGYVKACLELDRKQLSPMRQLSLTNFFWPAVEELSGLNLETMALLRAELKKEDDDKRTQQKIDSIITTLNAASDTDTKLNCLRDGLATVHSERFVLSRVESSRDDLDTDILRIVELASKDCLGVSIPSLGRFEYGLSGLRGLVALAGGSNIGKTVLLGQIAAETVIANPDTCCLFVTLEMPAQTIRQRILCYLSGLNRKEFAEDWKAGGVSATNAYYTYQEISPRVKFIEADDIKISVSAIYNEIEFLKLATGCSRCIVIVDYFNLWPVDETLYKTDMAQDSQRMNDFVALKKFIKDDGAVIMVCEIRKDNGLKRVGQHDEGDIAGHRRIYYNSGSVVFISQMSDLQICQFFAPSATGFFYPRDKPDKYISQKDVNKEANQEMIRQVREALDDKSIALLVMEVSKVRDGGKKIVFPLTYYWGRDCIVEGIHL